MTEWEDPDTENVYEGGNRESHVEDGKMSPEEDAFMQGYEEADEIENDTMWDDDEPEEEVEDIDEDEF